MSHIGDYVIEKQIGKGTVGEVIQCRDVRTRRRVALKKISKARIAQMHLSKHVKQEIKLMKEISHPNILHIIEVLASTKHLFLVLEWCPMDLFSEIEEKGTPGLSIPHSQFRFRELVDGVAYLHSKNISHRDLKPENILIDKKGHLRIADFGFAQMINVMFDSRRRMTVVPRSSFVGTMAYASPEVLSMQPYNAFKNDVWSIGVILHVMCFGRLPDNSRPSSSLLSINSDTSHILSDNTFSDHGAITTESEGESVPDIVNQTINALLVPDVQRPYIQDVLNFEFYRVKIEESVSQM